MPRGTTKLPEPTRTPLTPPLAPNRGKLAHLDPLTTTRVKNLAAHLVMEGVAAGRIPKTEEAIKAAMPQAFKDAEAAVIAAEEFLA